MRPWTLASSSHAVPVDEPPQDDSWRRRTWDFEYANYLPDEILLEILSYVPRDANSQGVLAAFCGVNRQWYDVGVSVLYEAPRLEGHAYSLFVRTVCPSVIPRVKKSQLSGLVKELNLSNIVHQGTKSTTARLLGRTKSSLELFVAPQASFAINCWASLSKCARLRYLDLSLVSEAINYQNLNQTLKKLPELRRLFMPRCSAIFEPDTSSRIITWPPRLQHLTLSGSVHYKFLCEMQRQPDTFPPTLHSVGILHCPSLESSSIGQLLVNLADQLTVVELRDLPAVKQGRLNGILNWLPNLTDLTISLDYISTSFGHRPPSFTASQWRNARPLVSLTLLTSGMRDHDPDRAFAITDLFELIDTRYLGRFRYLTVASSTGWESSDEGAELEALMQLVRWDLDRESWEARRWHYEGLETVGDEVTYREWTLNTELGRRMRPWCRVLWDR